MCVSLVSLAELLLNVLTSVLFTVTRLWYDLGTIELALDTKLHLGIVVNQNKHQGAPFSHIVSQETEASLGLIKAHESDKSL